jgi:hypothetical protein
MSVSGDLTIQNLDNLPMFNPLNNEAYIPSNTIFSNSLFFQAQAENTYPRNNDVNKVQCPEGKSLMELKEAFVCWHGYQNV